MSFVSGWCRSHVFVSEYKEIKFQNERSGKIKAQRVEQTVIRKNHPMWKTIDTMCFNSKNLYNYVNYLLRQEFIESGKLLNYYELHHDLNQQVDFKSCMSQPANCTMRALFKNWKSFLIAVKDWKKNPQKYLGMPKPPKYLNKDGRFPWMIPNNSCYLKDNNEIHFGIKKLQGYKWKTNAKGRLIQVRFVPKGSCYVMEVVTEIEIPDIQIAEPTNIAAIDLGVDNFATITNNIGLAPIIINGKGLKSVNQFYNKRRAELQSGVMKRNGKHWSKELEAITFKRNCRVKNYIHNFSRYTVNYCVDNNIDTLVCGLNKGWKQNCKMNSQSSQKFTTIPYNMFIKQLEYKCLDAGIKFITVDEAYTSGTSFLDGEIPCKENYDKSRRIKRGLFRSAEMLINSDVNGSLQIMRNVFPNAISYGIEGCLTPVIINAA